MIPLNPNHSAASYDFLRALPPFHRWKLPPGDEVEFHITARPEICGEYTRWLHDQTHIIVLSSKNIGHTDTLIRIMAHEIIHLKQGKDGGETSGQHNAEFKRLSAIVCRYHGFDLKAF